MSTKKQPTPHGISKIAKSIILDELEENTHPEKVEDVIFWALEEYAKREERTWGRTIAGSIVSRIRDEEGKYQRTNN